MTLYTEKEFKIYKKKSGNLIPFSFKKDIHFKPKRVLEKRKENSDQKFLNDLDKLFLSKRVAQKVPNGALKLNIPFLGGWFVYLGYELVKEIESKLLIPDSPFQIPTAFVDRVNSSIIYDKLENKLYFISDKSNTEIMEMYTDY